MPEYSSKMYVSSWLICQDVSGGKFVNARHWFPQIKSPKRDLNGPPTPAISDTITIEIAWMIADLLY